MAPGPAREGSGQISGTPSPELEERERLDHTDLLGLPNAVCRRTDRKQPRHQSGPFESQAVRGGGLAVNNPAQPGGVQVSRARWSHSLS